ncbi:MAG: HNH endonuclease [Planctomycetes bacterium]|nr:HNH endonuclease [Planctomycetota bacterium]
MEDPAAGPPAEPAKPERPLSSSVLVLNKHYMGLRVVTARRAFVLLFKSDAEVIDVDGEIFLTFDFTAWVDRSRARLYAPVDHDLFVRTPRLQVLVPKVIRLLEYDRLPRREVKFNRRNIIARDEYRCQYCGKRFSASHLSIDHIIPKSRGGKSIWTNVATACNPCNTRKGGRLPWEASMHLLRSPQMPRRNPTLTDKLRNRRYEMWNYFLRDGELAIDG